MQVSYKGNIMWIDRVNNAIITSEAQSFKVFFKSEKKWRMLDTNNALERSYCDAMWFGSGNIKQLEFITFAEGNGIIKEWLKNE